MTHRHAIVGLVAVVALVAVASLRHWHAGVQVPKRVAAGAPPAAQVEAPPARMQPGERLRPASASKAPKTPTLVSRLAQLEAAADAGNPAAAREVFHAAAKCVGIQIAKTLVPQTEALLTEDVSGLDAAALEERMRLLDNGRQEIEEIREYSDVCTGFPTDAVESGFMVRVALRAANLGDAGAASCYMSGDFQPVNFLSTDAAADEYRSNVLRLGDAGVKQGRPMAAYLLMQYYGHGGLTPLQRIGDRDVLKAYLYARLLLHIVEGGDGQQQMAGMVEAYRTEAAGLDIGSADDEARQLFERYYGHTINFDVNPKSDCR